MESGSEVVEEIDEESQDSEVLNVIPVQLEEGTTYEAVRLASPNPSYKSKYYKQTYRPAWEQMPDFKGWLRGVVGEPTRAYCSYCQKTLHAHRLSLLKHTCTIRHQKAAQIHLSKKNKGQSRQHHMEEVESVIMQDDEVSQEDQDFENEDDSETIEYTELHSEIEDEETKEVEEAEEEEEGSNEMQQIVFQKQAGKSSLSASQQSKMPVSTHVLDSTRGTPVTGLQVSLYKLVDGRWTYINEGITNINGRFSNFLEKTDFTRGRYKLHYDVDRYFDARKQDTMYPFIEIIFDVQSPAENYHIPLVLSPFGYSTYKGS